MRLLTTLGLALLPGLALAQVRDCQTFDAALGTPIEGALDANDCFLRDAIGSGSGTAYSKRYRLDVKEAAIVTIDAISREFDIVLLLYGSGTARLIDFSDNISPESTDARILAHLPPGIYTAIVTSARAGFTGTFRLAANGEKPRDCRPLPLPVSGVTEGAFDAATSCRFVDLEPFSSDAGYAQIYELAMSRNGVLSVQAETSAAEFGMLATTVGSFSAFGEKELLASLPAGQVLLLVAAFEEGPYKLTVAIESQRPCPIETLATGNEVSDVLRSTGCRFLDFQLPSSDPRPLKLYRYAGNSASVVRIDQTSSQFDTLLYLFDQQSRQLARNDDFERGTTNSRINIHLPAGSYLVGASTYDIEELGEYTLKVLSEAPRPCPASELSSGETREGVLSADGCRFLDLIPFSQNPATAAPFRLNAPSRKTVSISLRSNAPGETLSLLSPQLSEVLRLQVNPADRIVESDVTILSGTHTLVVWSAAATPPTYSLTATIQDPRNCPVNDLGPNDTQRGTLSGAPCRMTDVVPYFPVNNPVQTYRVNLPGRGRATVTMEASGFPPFLIAMRGTDSVAGQAFGSAQDVATFAAALAAGEYRFQLGTLGAASSFTVRSVFQPDSAASSETPDLAVAKAAGGEDRSVAGALRRAAHAVRGHSAATPLFQ